MQKNVHIERAALLRERFRVRRFGRVHPEIWRATAWEIHPIMKIELAN